MDYTGKATENQWLFFSRYQMKTFKEVRENFQDGRNPQDKGDMARHGLKGKSITQLKKVRSSDSASPREKQLAHWRINMSLGKKKDK
jgi:hypothetical protein